MILPEKMPGDLFVQNRLAQRKRSLASMHAKLERCKKSLALLATSLLPLAEVECVPWTRTAQSDAAFWHTATIWTVGE